MVDVLSFLLQYKYIIIFYLVVIGLVIAYWKKIDVQAKFIFLYRTTWGLKWMDKYGAKFREWIVLLGYIGVGAGYVGLVFISFILIKNLYDLIVKPTAMSGVSLVLPGVNVPGLGVLPFWYWLIAIFIIAAVHEFGHGIVARAHKIKVKHSGLVLFGPIIGAFVEPDENSLRKQKDITQYSVLAAGAFANILLGIVALILLQAVFMPLQNTMVEPVGFSFADYHNETFPAAIAGLPAGSVISSINNQETTRFEDFSQILFCTSPGENIDVVADNKNYALTLAEHPDDNKKSYLGIQNIKNEFTVKDSYNVGTAKVGYNIVDWMTGFLRWLFILSLGIGLFNLLPLPIVDGGRMAQVFLHKLKGKNKGENWYRKLSIFFLLLLLLNLFYPLLVKLL